MLNINELNITGRDAPRLLGGGTPCGVSGDCTPASRPVSASGSAERATTASSQFAVGELAADIIGLTGMSGAGKSVAARVFGECGFKVIDCDKEAREVIATPPCSEAVRRAFPQAYNDNGEFDRAKMAQIVFSEPQNLQKYEKIIYPFIIHKIMNIITTAVENAPNDRNFLLDAPTLYQSGADSLCRKVVAIIADKELCLRRIVHRDGIDERDAFLRLNAQPGAEFYRERADFFVENNGTLETLTNEILKIAKELK
ncbi:MAG: dephospho-CoA kinase [Oscillospiraceae bacterium]|nr:dephospho-CoA kinase [Oscillospiraceae bacterium]